MAKAFTCSVVENYNNVRGHGHWGNFIQQVILKEIDRENSKVLFFSCTYLLLFRLHCVYNA